MIIIKVLQIISANDNGGGANYVLNICSAPSTFYNSSLCCIGTGALYENSIKKNIEVVTFSVKDIFNGKLNTYLKEKKIDLLNFHGAKANFLYLFIKNNISIPVVVTVHSDYRYDFTNNKLKYILFTPLSIMGLKRFNNYICVSKHILQILDSSNFTGNKEIIENGIETNEYNINVKPIQIKEKYKIKDNDFLFTMVGRMHPIKNHQTLLKAFKKLRYEFINIKLMLIGDGTLMEELKEETVRENISEDVIFTGFQKNSLDYLNAGEISILPSFSEGGAPPLVVLESGLVHKPVICSDIGNMNEIIDDSVGYLINPNSVEDIYDKMKQAYLNKDMLPKMGNNLNKVVIKNYSIEKFWHKYYSFYREILQNETKLNK